MREKSKEINEEVLDEKVMNDKIEMVYDFMQK
jgi:hypothetical protein